MIDTLFPQVLPPDENYCIPTLNEIRFIGHRQTLSLVLGSCISTVFVGGTGPFVIAANHIVIANPREGSIIATKSAREQINEIEIPAVIFSQRIRSTSRPSRFLSRTR